MNKQTNSVLRSYGTQLRALTASVLLASCAHASASVTSPAIGNLLWSDEFNGPSLNSLQWTATNGNGCEIGLCGFGNQELQFYTPNNVSITDVPFEAGTRALRLRALRQTVGGNAFTSGKISSSGKVQVQYGMVEIRLSTPSITNGLWPAAWMLGVSPQTWPRNGEIDIMEMGHQAAVRAGAGSPTPSANNFVGANVITYETAACVPGNESCAASTAWQTKNWYVPKVPLTDRFVKYRLYWTDTEQRFTVVDELGEHDLYDKPLAVKSATLQSPFYLLLNLAVGGNFTDFRNAGAITAPLPADMYVDYVRVYQLDGKGTVKLGNQALPEVGKFGVFTDLTTVDNKQVAGASSDIFVWNNASTAAGTIAPVEGTNVIALNYKTPGQWFGAGVNSRQVHDMSGFKAIGTVKFKMKIPANVTFRVGIQDTYTNQGSVVFPANTTAYGMVRNGEWATATVPVSELAGSKVAVQSMLELFEVFSDPNNLPNAAFQFAIDDVVWDSGVPTGPKQTSEVVQTGPTTLKFTVNKGGWATVHYTVNNGIQQHIKMHDRGTSSTYAIGGLTVGNVVKYSFTYWDGARKGAVDTAQQSFTMK